MRPYLLFLISAFLFSCNSPSNQKKEAMETEPKETGIMGKKEYLESPFVTAGNRVYMVGHQDGSFPELGWHLKGEMGGIWNHPIKLMDGFDVALHLNDQKLTLDKADSFANFPSSNVHHFSFPREGVEVERWQFVPDDTEGVLIKFTVTNTTKTEKKGSLSFKGHSDLRPTWLGERSNMFNGKDRASYSQDIQGWIVKDSLNPWYVVYGGNQPLGAHRQEAQAYKGTGVSTSLEYPLDLGPGASKTFCFTIAGSYNGEENALKTYTKISTQWEQLAKAKQNRYAALASQSKLTIPDKQLEQTFEWLKYNCDWLVRTVPEIGTGIGAGIPDYPWLFGVDSEYSLMGYMAIGQEGPVYKTIHLLDSVSEATNGNGKIIHEMSTNGVVFNNGNINETPQFASLIWQIYLWNGDKEFLRSYFPTVKKGLAWLLEENDTDGNGFPEGFGMMEIHGLDSEMIDVAAYSQKGFADAANIALELDEDDLAGTFGAMAQKLKDKINTEFWSEDFNSYADFIGTDEQALHLIEDAIIRADTLDKPWAIKELEATREFIKNNPSKDPRPFVMHHNWVVNTPMEVGIADSTKALKALETAKQFVNPFGMFVTGIDRDNSAGSDDSAYEAPPIFTYTGAVMTLPTGVQARAENNYGRPNEALNYLERMSRSFSYALPGSMYEVSPDFGMMVQAWNIYSFAYPIIHQFFGIQPYAVEQTVTIAPQMPDKWDTATLENVKVGDNSISVFYTKVNGEIQVKVTQTQPEWKLNIQINGKTQSQTGTEIVFKG